MTIQWNNVTWYSKLLAVIVFVVTFFLGFWLGTMKAERVLVFVPYPTSSAHVRDVVATTSAPAVSVGTPQSSKILPYGRSRSAQVRLQHLKTTPLHCLRLWTKVDAQKALHAFGQEH